MQIEITWYGQLNHRTTIKYKIPHFFPITCLTTYILAVHECFTLFNAIKHQQYFYYYCLIAGYEEVIVDYVNYHLNRLC